MARRSGGAGFLTRQVVAASSGDQQMGMRLQYVSIPDSAIDRLRAEPELAGSTLMGAEVAAIPSELMAKIQKKMQAFGMGGIFPRIAKFDDAGDADDAGGGEPSGISGPNAVRGHLEKSWHGLHFIFTGTAEEAPPPLGYLLSGGEEVGEDLGYGSARAIRSTEVVAFRDSLHKISEAEFDRRFDLRALENNDIYPGIWDEDRDELLEEYQMYFEQLKTDLDKIVAAGHALLISIV
jgi:hypothetical protein